MLIQITLNVLKPSPKCLMQVSSFKSQDLKSKTAQFDLNETAIKRCARTCTFFEKYLYEKKNFNIQHFIYTKKCKQCFSDVLQFYYD